MINKHFSFRIEKCKNTTLNKNHCHSPHDIDEYIKDTSVHGWVIQDNLMLRHEYQDELRFQTMQLLMVSLLGVTNVDQYHTSLTKVTYSTKDSLLGIGTPTYNGSFF